MNEYDVIKQCLKYKSKKIHIYYTLNDQKRNNNKNNALNRKVKKNSGGNKWENLW